MAQEDAANIIDLNASRARVDDDVAANEGVLVGEMLAKARRSAGFSLASVSAETKIKIDHLAAVEASDFEALPITAYAVGFVKVYAGFLGLDAQELGDRFKAEREAATPVEAQVQASVAPTNAPHINNGARLVSIFGIVAILIFVVWIVMNVAGSPGENEAVRTVSTPERRVRLGDATLEGPVVRPRENAVPAIVESDPVPSDTSQAETGTTDAAIEQATFENVGASGREPLTTTAENDSSTEGANQLIQQEPTVLEVAQAEAVVIPEASQVPGEEIPPAADQTVESVIEPPVLENEASPIPATEAAIETVTAESVGEIPAPRTPQVRRVQEPAPIVVAAKLTRSLSPQYPNRCTRNAEPLETVTVMFDVTPKGRAANIRTVGSSNNCFENAAISTLRRWRFTPKTVNGVAQADIGKQATLNFRR